MYYNGRKMKFSWIHKRSVINNPMADPSRLHCNGIEIGSVFVKVTGPATWAGWLWMHSLAPGGKHTLSTVTFPTKAAAKEALLVVVRNERMEKQVKIPAKVASPTETTSAPKPEEGEGTAYSPVMSDKPLIFNSIPSVKRRASSPKKGYTWVKVHRLGWDPTASKTLLKHDNSSVGIVYQARGHGWTWISPFVPPKVTPIAKGKPSKGVLVTTGSDTYFSTEAEARKDLLGKVRKAEKKNPKEKGAHVFRTCACGEGSCPVCQGLSWCSVCDQAEGELEDECPGFKKV